MTETPRGPAVNKVLVILKILLNLLKKYQSFPAKKIKRASQIIFWSVIFVLLTQLFSNEISLKQLEPTTNISDRVTSETRPTYQVIKVIDGDTIKLDMNGTIETIRLIGIDTPETVHPSRPAECFGIEASNKAKQLLEGQTVGFESDGSQDTRDKYGRLLGYIFLSSGQNFSQTMLELGYANEYTYTNPYRYQADFQAAEKFAQANKLGLWADVICNN